MPEHTTTLRRARASAIACLLGGVLALAVAPVSASGSQGSVPAEVATYANDESGLLADLDDLFGIGSGGDGVDFNDTTEIGQLNRVFAFTPDFLAGVATDAPVERLNEWTAPITVNDAPIGVATIWINPATVAPELADFVRGSTVTVALSDIADDASLVRDDNTDAWFSLEGGMLSPLVSGTSGISGATPLSVYQGLLGGRDATVPAPVSADTGTLTSIVVIAMAIVGVTIILLVPQLIARRREPADPEADPTD